MAKIVPRLTTVIATRNPAVNDLRSLQLCREIRPKPLSDRRQRSLPLRRKIRPKKLSDWWQRSRCDRSHRAKRSGQKRYANLTAIAPRSRINSYNGISVIECLINNSYFFYANFFCLSIFFFCRLCYCVTFIVAFGTLLFVIKLLK